LDHRHPGTPIGARRLGRDFAGKRDAVREGRGRLADRRAAAAIAALGRGGRSDPSRGTESEGRARPRAARRTVGQRRRRALPGAAPVARRGRLGPGRACRDRLCREWPWRFRGRQKDRALRGARIVGALYLLAVDRLAPDGGPAERGRPARGRAGEKGGGEATTSQKRAKAPGAKAPREARQGARGARRWRRGNGRGCAGARRRARRSRAGARAKSNFNSSAGLGANQPQRGVWI
jgi:hypothetical protein